MSPNIERDANPFPNPEQIARDQADAVRLASLAAQGEVGLANNVNTHNIGVEQGEIPPVNTQNQVVYGIPQETGENSPENINQRETTEQGNTTGEIPPNQTRERDEEGAVGGNVQVQGTPQHPTKIEEVSREENAGSPVDLNTRHRGWSTIHGRQLVRCNEKFSNSIQPEFTSKLHNDHNTEARKASDNGLDST